MYRDDPNFEAIAQAQVDEIMASPHTLIEAVVRAAVERSLIDGDTGATADVQSADKLRDAIRSVSARIIPHRYGSPAENVAQYEADGCGRQEVTIDFHLKHMTGFPFWRWMEDEYLSGRDPWHLLDRLPIAPKEAKCRGWRIFVDKDHLPEGTLR